MYQPADFAISADQGVKENEKWDTSKYPDFARALKKVVEMETVIPIIGDLGKIFKNL